MLDDTLMEEISELCSEVRNVCVEGIDEVDTQTLEKLGNYISAELQDRRYREKIE